MSVAPLAGFTIAVTALRRHREFGSALEHRGARIVYAPALRVVPPMQDAALFDATKRLLDDPPDLVVITTAAGFRGWLDAADVWGVGPGLRHRLAGARVLARGPRSQAAAVSAGIAAAWAPAHECAAELIQALRELAPTGAHVALQTHGEALPDLADALAQIGARITLCPTFRGIDPEDPRPLASLLQAITAGTVDAVTFTSALASTGFLRAASTLGITASVAEAFRTGVLAAGIGPVTAAPLLRAGIDVLLAPRHRLTSLVRELTERLPQRRGLQLLAAGHRIEVRGHAVVVDGALVTPGADVIGLLRTLADGPVPEAAEADRSTGPAIDRLRAVLGDSRIVLADGEGYRLAHEHEVGLPTT
jgi:uroporphyrinogen-III synthase